MLLAGSLLTASHAQSITKATEETVNTPFSSASIIQWFELIEKQGITLSYNAGIIDLQKKCSLPSSTKQMKAGALLNALLCADYKVTLVNAEPVKIILSLRPRQKYTLTGTIKESNSIEQLYGATLTFTQQGRIVGGCITNEAGFYSITLPEGNYDMEANYIGYKAIKSRIHMGHDKRMDLELAPSMVELDEVIVAPARRATNELNETSPSNMLSFSSSDIFAEMHILPGVSPTQAGTELQINGGNSDENLMLLDGIPIYHNNHINPMMPVFNGDAIKSVTLHKSFFPTQYEGRLSSVIDIKLKEGNKNKHSQTLTLDMPSASAMLEGPIVKEKLSYMISARSSWIDQFDGVLAEEERANHSFCDFNTKLHYSVSPKVSLEALTYHAMDNFYFPFDDKKKRVLRWSNQLYALKLSTQLGKKLFNTTTASYTNYTNKAFAGILGYEEEKFLSAGVSEASFNTMFNCNIDNLYHLNFGIKGSYEQLNYTRFTEPPTNQRFNIGQISAFYDNELQLTPALNARIGINMLVYMPQGNENYYSFQPRFSLKYAAGEKHLFYLGASRMEQFYHYLQLDAIALPTDLRMPTVSGFKPRMSNHYEAGWTFLFAGGNSDLSFYYKVRQNIISLRPDIYPGEDEWKSCIMTGKGDSYGMKLYFLKEWRRMAVQAAYTWSSTTEHYAEYLKGKCVPSFYDIPHILNLAVSCKISQASAFSVGAHLHSGRIRGIIDIIMEDGSASVVEKFRCLRYPFSYRVDAGYTYSKYFARTDGRLVFRLGMYNIIGNPTEEDFINFYSINIGKNCIPYGSISWKF